MKKLNFLITTLLLLSLTSCNSSSSQNSTSNYSSNSSSNYSNYDYNKGYGYTEPKSGESFSDYIKRQDPDLYNSMQDRYDSLK